MGKILIDLLYYAIAIYVGIRVYRFNRDQDYKASGATLVPIKSKEFIIILINFFIIGIHALLIFFNSPEDKLFIVEILGVTLNIYLWTWIIVEYNKYKRSNKKKYFIFAIVSLLIIMAIFSYAKSNLEGTIMYTEINSIPEKDIYLYKINEEAESDESFHYGLLKYRDNIYKYSWSNEYDQKENPPTLEIEDTNNDGKEELLIIFNDKLYNENNSLYSTIDLDTGERLDRYESDLFTEIEGNAIALDEYFMKITRINLKENMNNIESIYLNKIKEHEYFLIKNKNQNNCPNFLMRTRYGRVDDVVELSSDAEYEDYKLSKNGVYMAINFSRETEEKLATNSIDIIKLKNSDPSQLIKGAMKKEKTIGEFDYSILDYEFDDNFKFIIDKSVDNNKEKEEFEIIPTKTN
ncbi:hypothetical protein GOQ29_03760 [Clostridium sp. D2Q-14]|uniref:hypothetical protein n=1 Tax=Anaeromonas gelatinilytica TaxID=2683194 RepID=UPI00193B7C70|nr:hypothetical protein [Anaeromonas gelatinilytica]MBS4534728.1 hypothetical protein [Anaeromonas gelatinilytica]